MGNESITPKTTDIFNFYASDIATMCNILAINIREIDAISQIMLNHPSFPDYKVQKEVWTNDGSNIAIKLDPIISGIKPGVIISAHTLNVAISAMNFTNAKFRNVFGTNRLSLSGNGTYSVPSGITEIIVEASGAGGGGGGGYLVVGFFNSPSFSRYYSGGSGGNGEFVKTRIAVTTNQKISYSVGTGGGGGVGGSSRGNNATNGGNGSDSIFGSVVAKAGTLGTAAGNAYSGANGQSYPGGANGGTGGYGEASGARGANGSILLSLIGNTNSLEDLEYAVDFIPDATLITRAYSNLRQMAIYLNNRSNWFYGSSCNINCQVSCQYTCQLACQVCYGGTCHDQNCGGWS